LGDVLLRLVDHRQALPQVVDDGVAAVVGLAACSAEPASSPVPTELPTVQPTAQLETPEAERLLSLGHQLFVSKGCAACHGQDAEGTEIAPPLSGHTSAVVKRQARADGASAPVVTP
ncbi:c-type cytochrome, partial [bacterium]|nr:c-type cytochrome [bacterium]